MAGPSGIYECGGKDARITIRSLSIIVIRRQATGGATDSIGIAGGAEAGFNFQTGMIVAGIETDVGYLGGNGSAQSPLGPGITMLTSTGGADVTLRGRLGVAAGNALIYGTAGVMIADVGASVQEPYIISAGDDGAIFTSKTGLQVGWVAGGGVEYALADNWSIKGEALAYDLGSRQVSGPFLNDSTVPPRIYGWNVDNMGTTIRIGLNKGL